MNKLIILSLTLIFVTSCSSDPVILEPGVVSLSFPINNEACLETTSINDTQASVEFRWEETINAESYELGITNLMTNELQSFPSTTNQKVVTLLKAEPYSWKVTAVGEEDSTPSDSETWQFYLAGDAVVNFAPFPAELIRPISGSVVTPINGQIILQWNCRDADDDLASFRVYLDSSDATKLIQTLDAETVSTQIQVSVENNQVYYWKIVADDANENETSSGVYSFRTN